MIYTVQLNNVASITLDVEARDEGEALQKARDLAEEAPMSSFSILEELQSSILNVSDR